MQHSDWSAWDRQKDVYCLLILAGDYKEYIIITADLFDGKFATVDILFHVM